MGRYWVFEEAQKCEAQKYKLRNAKQRTARGNLSSGLDMEVQGGKCC